MAESHEGENVTLLHMAHREYMTGVPLQPAGVGPHSSAGQMHTLP
jgi:hypothetical protein